MKYLTLKQLSEITSISVFTFRKYTKLGMPYYKVGRKILVDPDEFEVWFKNKHRHVAHADNSDVNQVVDEVLDSLK